MHPKLTVDTDQIFSIHLTVSTLIFRLLYLGIYVLFNDNNEWSDGYDYHSKP